MSQEYSNPKRSNDKYSLPDVEIFQLTAREVAEMDEDLVYEYVKRSEFRLASMNSRDRDAMLDAIVEEEGIKGGYFWHTCLPGCLPDSQPFGPFATYQEALQDARDSDGDCLPEDEPEEDEA
jgi:hypothetical protein